MKLKTTIILLIVAAIGFAYVFLYERKQFTTEQAVQRAGVVFPDFYSGRVARIEIKTADQTTLLEKTDGLNWRALKPISVRASESEVNSILSEFQHMKKISNIEINDNTDLDSYGLQEPLYAVSMWTGNVDPTQATPENKEYTHLYVGAKRPGGDEVYVRLEGGKEMLLVPGTIHEKLGKGINDIRSKKVFDVMTDAVEMIELQYAAAAAGDDTLNCVRKGNEWRFTTPVTDLCDDKRVVGIINKLVGLRIDKNDFITEDDSDLARYGLGMPKITVTLGRHGEKETLLLGHTLDEKVYAKRKDAPSIFMLPEATLSSLTVKTNDMRSRSLCKLEPLNVDKFNMELGGTTVTIGKTKEYDWKFFTPVDIFADSENCKALINTIRDMEIQGFVADNQEDVSQWGLDAPTADFKILNIKDKTLVHIQVGKKDEMGKLCYIRRGGENSIFMVKAEGFYEEVTNPVIALRDRILIDFQKETAERLVVERKDRSFVCEKSKEDPAKWNLLEPIKTTADKTPVNNIVWTLAYLKAERCVVESPKDLGEFGLDDPAIKLTITYKERVEETLEERKKDWDGEIYLNPKVSTDPPVTSTVLVGKQVKPIKNANYYAMLAGGDLVFELGWSDVRDFKAELAPTRILPFDKAQVRAVSLAFNDEELAYEFRHEAWEMLKPESKNVDRREVEVLTYNFENLMAESIEHYSTDDLAQFGLENPWFKAQVELEDEEFMLYIGGKAGDDRYYAKSAQSDFIYTVKTKDVERLMGIEPGEDESLIID